MQDLILQRMIDLEHRIYGNGQPGDMARMSARVRVLEEFRWKALAAFSTIVAVIGFLTGDGIFSLKHFLDK